MQTHLKLILNLLFILSFNCAKIHAQELKPPEWMLQINQGIETNHFPEIVNATKVISKNDTLFYWKHNTSFMNTTKENITVEEAGAYINISGSWTLRIKYNKKEFCKLFNCPKGILKPLQPYTFTNNWRTGKQLNGGYALWYVKGKNKNGEKFIGFKTLYTSDSIHTNIIN